MPWMPVKNTPTPLYRQIYLYLRNKILSGNLPVNTRLPAQRGLAAHFQVDRSTLRLAIEELIADGLLKSKVGSGIWVANNTWSQFTSPSPIAWHDYIKQSAYPANLPLIQEINRLEFADDIIRLGTGELSPSLLPTTELRVLIKATADQIDHFGYEEPLGLLHLRRQISFRLKKLGIAAEPESILIVSGALQALQLILFGLLPENARLFIEKPSYLSSLKLMQSLKVKVTEFPLDKDGIVLDGLYQQHKIFPHAFLYTIPTFHNPTGGVMRLSRRHDLLRACQEMRLPVIEDDVYRELWLDQLPPAPLKALDTTGNVLYIDSLSKSVGPGLRIGWIVGPEPVIAKLADLKMQTDYGSSTLSQWVAAEWLASNAHENHLAWLRGELRLRRQMVGDLLTRYFTNIASWRIPHGGFYLWLTLRKPISLHRLFKASLTQNLLLNPGCLYDNIDNTHLRLSYAYADLNELKTALPKLAELIKKEY